MTVTMPMDTETIGSTDLETLFQESIPCLHNGHEPATHYVSHPPNCKTFFCTPCIREIEEFLKRVEAHLKSCPAPHAHVLHCVPCNRDVHLRDLRIKPMP